MEIWLNKSILSKHDLQIIEQRISQLKAPHSAGRLPLKIASGFSGFTADQWKIWTISYSPIALRGILPREHLQYWLLYVKACSLICVRCLSKQNIELSDKYFKLFFCKFLDINGAQCCTPNMHLHMHLKECLLDYGPPYSFWCFGFERFNGILGSFPTNKKYIEPQIMKKCLMLQELHNHTFPSEGETFQSILSGHLPSISGSLLTSMASDREWSKLLVFSAPVLEKELSFVVGDNEKCIPPIKQAVLDSDKVKLLEGMYKFIYPEAVFLSINRFVKQSSRASLFNEVFGSNSMSRENGTVISAYWPVNDESSWLRDTALPLSVGQIQFFIKHELVLHNESKKQDHILAYVRWYKKKHSHSNWFGSSAVVLQTEFEADTCFSFIPLQRFSSLCIFGKLNISFTDDLTENILVASPLNSKHNYVIIIQCIT